MWFKKRKVISFNKTPSEFYELVLKNGFKTDRLFYTREELTIIVNHPNAFHEVKNYLANLFSSGKL